MQYPIYINANAMLSDGEIWRPLPDEGYRPRRYGLGWGGKREKQPPKRGAVKWRAGKTRCMAITTTCVSCLEDDKECMVYVSYIVAWARSL